MITVHSLSKSFSSTPLWQDFSATIEAGKVTALIGASGSGKSTLLNCLGALDFPDSGEILVNGEDITRYSSRKKRQYRRHIVGYLFQDLCPHRE